jgi:hypothetical protein
MTYDRAVLKIEAGPMVSAHERLHKAPPKVNLVLATSQKEGYRWRYTFWSPGPGWFGEGYNDLTWQRGPGGFGTQDTPGAGVRTEWKSSDIWMRRVFDLPPGDLRDPHFLIHHDEDAEVYLNGVLAAKLAGYTTSYVLVRLSPKSRAALRPGSNLMAIHCRQTGGGQYIDAGLVDVIFPLPE